jgi:hypothetical protein
MIAALARGALVVVLVVAGVAKLRDRAATRSSMTALFPRVGAAIAAVLPWFELALAIALIAAWTSPVPAIVAGIVILGFTAVLVVAEVRRVPCPCFGASASVRPVGGIDIVRNGLLLAGAVLATAT